MQLAAWFDEGFTVELWTLMTHHVRWWANTQLSVPHSEIYVIYCVVFFKVLLIMVESIPLNTSVPSSELTPYHNAKTVINNVTYVLSDGVTYQNDSLAEEDSFVEDTAGVWVISVMSGTCLLTIAFIVRALFSRAEAFRDPQENMFNQDNDVGQMGIGFGTTTVVPSSDFGYL